MDSGFYVFEHAPPAFMFSPPPMSPSGGSFGTSLFPHGSLPFARDATLCPAQPPPAAIEEISVPQAIWAQQGIKRYLSGVSAHHLSGCAGADICSYYFNGLAASVDLLGAVRCLLILVRRRFLPVLDMLSSDENRLRQAASRYVRLLASGELACCKLNSGKSEHALDSSAGNADQWCRRENDDVYVIWVCHMIDSWAYHNDCQALNPQACLVDHQLKSNDHWESSDVDQFLSLRPAMQNIIGNQNRQQSGFLSSSNARIRPSIDDISIRIVDAISWLHKICYSFAMPHFQDDRFQETAIRRYYVFLAVLRAHPAMFSSIARPSDIMLVWMAHCLHPRQYRKDIRMMLGESSIVLLERVLVQPRSYTPDEISQIWGEMYDGSDLVLPGTLHRPLLAFHRLHRPQQPFAALLMPFLVVAASVSENTCVDDELFLDTDGRTRLIPIRANVSFNAFCDTDIWPIIMNNRNWSNRASCVAVGHLQPPFESPVSSAQLGRDVFVVVQAQHYVISLIKRGYGARPLPPLLVQYLDVHQPASNLVIYYARANRAGLSKSVQSSLSFHVLTDALAIFMFATEAKPSVVCRQLNPSMLAHRSQLLDPDLYPCGNPNHLSFSVIDKKGERLIFVVNPSNRREPIQVHVLDPDLGLCLENGVELPLCRGCNELRTRTPPFGEPVDADIRCSHATLHSSAFPFLLCLSFAIFVLGFSDYEVTFRHYKGSVDLRTLVVLSNRGPVVRGPTQAPTMTAYRSFETNSPLRSESCECAGPWDF